MEALINAFAGAVEANLVWIVLACYVVGAVLALALLEKKIRSAFRYVHRVGVKRITQTVLTAIWRWRLSRSVQMTAVIVAGEFLIAMVIIVGSQTGSLLFFRIALLSAVVTFFLAIITVAFWQFHTERRP
jgi:peptidoglycan/LPS O-acetylase OafA/YrhL